MASRVGDLRDSRVPVPSLAGRLQVSHNKQYVIIVVCLFVVCCLFVCLFVVYSLRTLFRKCNEISSILLVVRTSEKEVW